LVFVLDDGSRVDAVRRVMARSSDVFSAMLTTGHFRESADREVHIPAAAPAAFRTMVAWLHGHHRTGHSPPALDELCDLVSLVHRFQIADAARRRMLLAPLIAAAFDGGEDRFGGKLMGHGEERCDGSGERENLGGKFGRDEGERFGWNFARIYRLLSVYDDSGHLRRDLVVSLLTRPMSLHRRCAAVAGVVSTEADCDVAEFVSVIAAALLDAIN